MSVLLSLADKIDAILAGGVKRKPEMTDLRTLMDQSLISTKTLMTPVVGVPASGTITMAWEQKGGLLTILFTLAAARIAVTDAAASGSSGSTKLADLPLGAWSVIGCRQKYTAFAEGTALTTAAGDAAFVLAVGSVAANAGDGALTGTEADIGSVTGTLTNSGGTTTGTKVSGPLGAIDGSGTATDILLNFSGTAATIDANSTLDVTGTILVVLQNLGGNV